MRRRPGIVVWVVLAVGAGACMGSPSDPGEGAGEGEGRLGSWVRAQLRTRTYSLHTPSGWDGETPAPVVIALHGAGETGSAFRSRIGLDAHADRLGWIAVYPDGIQGTWSVGCGSCTTAERLGVDDFFFLRTLVEHLDDHLAIDRDRIYVVGFSQGGMAAGWMACRGLPGLAGVGLVAAPVVATVQAWCAPPEPLPVVHVHGAADPVLPWNGAGSELPSIPTTLDLWAGVNGCGEPPEVRDVAGTPGEPGAVERWDWPGCAPGSLLRLYRVEGGGHGWFGARGSQVDLDTSGALLEAFDEVTSGG